MAVCIIALVLKNDVGGSLALIKSFQVARSITFAENWPDAIFVCIYMFLVLFKYIRNVFIFFAGIFPFWFSSDLTKDNTICFPSWEHVTQARKENFAEERSTFSKTDWGHHQRLAFEIYIDLFRTTYALWVDQAWHPGSWLSAVGDKDEWKLFCPHWLLLSFHIQFLIRPVRWKISKDICLCKKTQKIKADKEPMILKNDNSVSFLFTGLFREKSKAHHIVLFRFMRVGS